FKLILSDEDVKAIFVNIFGGIVRCDMIAEGIIAAVKEVDVKVPVIVRLEGTNVEEGKKLLRESGLAITPADDINDGARKAVAAVPHAAAGTHRPSTAGGSAAARPPRLPVQAPTRSLPRLRGRAGVGANVASDPAPIPTLPPRAGEGLQQIRTNT